MNEPGNLWLRIRGRVLGALALGLLLGLAYRCLLVVDETEYVVVVDFGRPIAVFGDEPGESGLHAKWPWHSSIEIDRRLRVFDPPAREVITGDKRSLEVGSYVAWKVADPQVFLRAAATVDSAEVRLGERVSAAVSDAIGTRPLASLASTASETWALDGVTAEIREAVAGPARTELGIDLVDVGLRRFNHPVEVRPAVFELIRSERKLVAATLRSEGEAAYLTRTSQADRERDAILSRAEAEAQRIEGRGEAEATRILNQAHARDPRFFEFLRTLETYSSILDEKTTIVLSSTSPLLRLLTQGPTDLPPDPITPAPSPPTVGERAAAATGAGGLISNPAPEQARP